MTGVKYNLDEQIDAVSSFRIVEDLTFPCSFMEIVFVLGEDLDFTPNDGVIFHGSTWQFQSYTKLPAYQAYQYSAFGVLKGSLKVPSRTLRTPIDIVGQGFLPAIGRYSAAIKFGTPIKGDTLAVLLRNLQFQSLEENKDSLSSSLCLSITTQGVIAGQWKTLTRNSVKFNQDTGLLRPEVTLSTDQDYWEYDHTPVQIPETQASYFKRLFGNKVVMRSNSLLTLGKAYSFDLQGLGARTTKKYLLVRQEYAHQSTGDGLLFNQMFAEVL